METEGKKFNYLNEDYSIIPHISIEEDCESKKYKINYIMIMLNSGLSYKCSTKLFEENSYNTRDEAEEYAYSYSMDAIKNGDITF